VIHLMEDQRYIDYVGGSMRLGAYTCKLCPDSLAHRSYGSLQISERHRHRYEFN
ncbi:MAG TPA: CTP synthase, partial [Candidatus Cloacimonas sp.]|nr:CTP synthase [Candidatus Cloacimonas sp.]